MFHSRYWQKEDYYTALVAAAPGLRSYTVVGSSKNPYVPATLPRGQLQKFHFFDFVQPKNALFSSIKQKVSASSVSGYLI